MNRTIKKIIGIALIVIVGLALFTLPAFLWPEARFAQVISWPALFIQWLLYYILLGIEGLLWVVAVVNIFVGGYTRSGWGRLVVCLLIGLALFGLVRWVLMTTGVVPFSDKVFVPVF